MSLHVLILEDRATDAVLLVHELERAGFEPAWRRADTEADYVAALDARPDVILADCKLPGFDALRALDRLRERRLDVPFIVVTGGFEEMAVECLKRGAADYLLKDRLARLGHAVGRALEEARLREAKRVAEAALGESEERYRLIMENINDAIFLVDVAGNLVLANRRAEEMTGYRFDELAGRPTFLLFGSEEQRQVRARLDAVAAGHEVSPLLETQIVRKDGRHVWVEAHVASIVEDGRVVGRVGVVRDITERKRAEEALAAQACQQAAVAQLGQRALAEDLVALMDEAVEIAAGTLGVEYGAVLELPAGRDELLLRAGVGWRPDHVGRVTVPARGDSLAAYTLRVREPVSFEDLESETRFTPHPALREHGVVSGLGVVVEGPDRPFGVLAVYATQRRAFTHDEVRFVQSVALVLATAIRRKRLEEQLVHTEKIATMGQLLAGVAHELNNPLAVVLGQTALLRRALGTSSEAERAERAARAAERCARIVKNFLALARQQEPERQDVSLNQVILEAVDLLAYSFRVDSVEIALDLPDDLPVIRADPHQLHQVVVNLITNAHQAMRHAPPPRRLTVTTRSERVAQRVRMEVADTGPGIPVDLLPKIFEPFFTTKAAGEGTGLGLPFCQGIVEGHGGSIRVEGAPGSGAVFVVELPAGRPPGIEAPASPRTETAIKGKTVLVVDDESEVADLLADMLALDDHQVDTATNGTAALEKIAARAYDVIMTDMRMPGLDGRGLYRELERRQPELCRRMVFLTGDSLSPDTLEFLERVGAPSLGKPFELEGLRRAIQTVLGGPTAGPGGSA